MLPFVNCLCIYLIFQEKKKVVSFMEPEGLGKLSNVPLCSASHPAFQQAWTSPHPGITLQDVPRELSAGDHGTTICQSQGEGKVTIGLKVDACMALQAASQEA